MTTMQKFPIKLKKKKKKNRKKKIKMVTWQPELTTS